MVWVCCGEVAGTWGMGFMGRWAQAACGLASNKTSRAPAENACAARASPFKPWKIPLPP